MWGLGAFLHMFSFKNDEKFSGVGGGGPNLPMKH